MRSNVGKFLAVIALISAAQARGQVIHAGDCVVDAQVWRLPTCALDMKSGRLYVKHIFLPAVFKETKNRLAWDAMPEGDWAYIDRTGLIRVRNVASLDNGPDPIKYGLVRVSIDGKWGLSNLQGGLIAPLSYDGIMPYQPSVGWKACTGCRTVTQGEYHSFVGGRWVQLDPSGRIHRILASQKAYQ